MILNVPIGLGPDYGKVSVNQVLLKLKAAICDDSKYNNFISLWKDRNVYTSTKKKFAFEICK